MMPLLTVILPAYNEAAHIGTILERLVGVALPSGGSMQILVVDDGSEDQTAQEVRRFMAAHPDVDMTLSESGRNQGKGAAIRSVLPMAKGKYTVIQDGDEEYHPEDLAMMVGLMMERGYGVLYGSRYLGGGRLRKSLYPTYYYGVRLLSVTTNLLYRQHITDEATCYKMFTTPLLQSLPLRSRRFEFCPEVTALTALRGWKIPEVPIRYTPRSKEQGKKIRALDGWQAWWVLVKMSWSSRKVKGEAKEDSKTEG